MSDYFVSLVMNLLLKLAGTDFFSNGFIHDFIVSPEYRSSVRVQVVEHMEDLAETLNNINYAVADGLDLLGNHLPYGLGAIPFAFSALIRTAADHRAKFEDDLFFSLEYASFSDLTEYIRAYIRCYRFSD